MASLQGSVVRRIRENDVQKYAVCSLYLLVPAFILVGIAKNSSILMLGMILYAICKSKTPLIDLIIGKYIYFNNIFLQ